jgi:hypothetical protein
LELRYGLEADINCTIAVTDPVYHLLEFYIHNDAPLTCRMPARPRPHIALRPDSAAAQAELDAETAPEYVPLVFAIAGQLQLSHLHVSTHMNILLHSVPRHHLQKHDSGVIDSGAAYSTSPLAGTEEPTRAGTYELLPHLNANQRLVIGDDLHIHFSVRWFPTPSLPESNGRYEWNGMGGHVYASTVFYMLVAFGAGVASSTVYFFGVILPKRLRDRGRNMGGATPLGGYGGWVNAKRAD